MAGLRAVGCRSRRWPARSTRISTSYISPDQFQPLITIYIFLAVTAGGVGGQGALSLGALRGRDLS